MDAVVGFRHRLVLGGTPETVLRQSRVLVLARLAFCVPLTGRWFCIGRKSLHQVPALRGRPLTWLCFALEEIGAVSHLHDGFGDLTTPKLPTLPEMPAMPQPLPPAASWCKPSLAPDPEGWGGGAGGGGGKPSAAP